MTYNNKKTKVGSVSRNGRTFDVWILDRNSTVVLTEPANHLFGEDNTNEIVARNKEEAIKAAEVILDLKGF